MDLLGRAMCKQGQELYMKTVHKAIPLSQVDISNIQIRMLVVYELSVLLITHAKMINIQVPTERD